MDLEDRKMFDLTSRENETHSIFVSWTCSLHLLIDCQSMSFSR